MNKKTSIKEIRQFAFIMAVMILFLFAFLFPWIYGLAFSKVPYIIASLFVFSALLVPRSLRPVHRLWLKFSLFLGFINSRILLFIIYYFMLVPIGFVAGLFGFDPMKKKQISNSYYIQRNEDNNNMENPF
ncbi:MAG: sxtJ [gamma proteobacterium symbiont of Taylorina sp.]|nr:sxtJ [gamma proteobacterium symbiont of Taylorina sp.]